MLRGFRQGVSLVSFNDGLEDFSMRSIVMFVGMLLFPLWVSAQEAEVASSVVAMAVEEEVDLYGKHSWWVKVRVDRIVDKTQMESLKQLTTQLLEIKSEDLAVGGFEKDYVNFTPVVFEIYVPIYTEDGPQLVTDFRTAKQPALEEIRFAKAGENTPVTVKFRKEASMVEKLTILLAVAKFIEGRFESGSNGLSKLRLLRDDETTYTFEKSTKRK